MTSGKNNENEKRNGSADVWRAEKRNAKKEGTRSDHHRQRKMSCICTKPEDGRATGAAGHQLPLSPIGTVSCTATVLGHRTGGPPELPDISWPLSPILSHGTGGPLVSPDISWPSSPICTACVLSRRTGRCLHGRSVVLHEY